MNKQHAQLQSKIKDIVSSQLGLGPNELDCETAFFSMGVTSLISEEIVLELGQTFGTLPSTLLFEYPSIQKLSDFLFNKRKNTSAAKKKIAKKSSSKTAKTRFPSGTEKKSKASMGKGTKGIQLKVPDGVRPDKGYAIAVIGLSGRFPMARDKHQFWKNLIAKRDCIVEIPPERWDYARYYAKDRHQKDTLYSKWGGFIDDIDKFDPLFFHLSNREAESLDPQQKIFLECSWEAMEDAGYADLSRRTEAQVGVYVGVTWNEFSLINHEAGFLADRYTGAGALYWGISNRVSFFMDLTGPSMAIDTACSSSLVAIHEACQAILSGDCDMAIAGGINLNLHPSKYIFLSQSNFLDSEGKCRSFGDGGDGYVPGEGAGAVILKPLEKALADGDVVYGIIRGTATNHGGKATGYTVPNPEAQQKVIASAFDRAQVHPEEISYVECHGTGTALGDPIEIKGLSVAFEAHTAKKQFCGIGSVKSNIGHLEAAAGVVGLIKVLLGMRYQTLPASLHAENLNPKIDFKGSPFFHINDNLEWAAKENTGQFAGVSSFGAGGSNAHLIVESFPPSEIKGGRRVKVRNEIFVLSTQTAPQLIVYAKKMAAFISDVMADPILHGHYAPAGIAHTLQTRRQVFTHRLAVVAKSLPELREKLTGFSAEQEEQEGVFVGDVQKPTADTLQKDAQNLRSLKGRAAAWVRGEIDALKLFGRKRSGRLPATVSLPTYPFLRETSWLTEDDVLYRPPSAARFSASRALHPFIDANRSTARIGKFEKTFSTTEYVLAEHLVADRNVIPGVCHLEAACTAGKLWSDQTISTIKDVWWSTPIAVGNEPQKVAIELQIKNSILQFVIKNADDGEEIIYSQGKMFHEHPTTTAADTSHIDIGGLASACTDQMDIAEIYRKFTGIGIIQKDSFQVIKALHLHDRYALAKISLPRRHAEEFESYRLHPSLIDGAVQTAMMHLLHRWGHARLIVPFHIGAVQIIQPLTPEIYVHATVQNMATKQYNLVIADQNGRPLVLMKDFILKEFKQHTDLSQNSTYYLSELKEKALSPSSPREKSSHLVVFDTGQELQDALVQAAAVHTDQITWVTPSQAFERKDGGRFAINPGRFEDYQQLAQHMGVTDDGVQILFLWNFDKQGPSGLDVDRIHAELDSGIYAVFYLTKALLQHHKIATLLYFCQGEEDDIEPHKRALSGFFRTLHLEKPEFRFKVVQCDDGYKSRHTLAQLALNEIGTTAVDARPEFEIVYQNQQRFVQTYVQGPGTVPRGTDLPVIRRKGQFLITGGMGGLGLVFARYLCETYAAKVILAGRSALNPEKEAILKRIPSAGGAVRYIQCDLTQQDDVNGLIAKLVQDGEHLNGILHAAGVIEDAFIFKKERRSFQRVIAPKIFGALHLDRATKEMPLDFFVLFSSISAALGNTAQCDYAYANAFLNHFAVYRERLRKINARRGRTISLGWPYWKDGGMKILPAEEQLLFRAFGISPLATKAGIKAFEEGLRHQHPQLILMDGDIEKIHTVLGLRKAPSKSNSRTTGRAPHPADAKSDLPRDESASRPNPDGNRAETLRRAVDAYLINLFSSELKIAPERIDITESFDKYGFDSIIMINFINRMEEKFGTLPKTLFFEHKTIQETRRYFIEHHADQFGVERAADTSDAGDGDADPESGEISPAQASMPEGAQKPDLFEPEPAAQLNSVTAAAEDIAIIGVAGRYPQSDTLAEYWNNLKRGRHCITEIPRERWDFRKYHQPQPSADGYSYAKWGGFIDDVDKFDSEFFNIAPKEANYMDPQERLFLETAWSVVEDAGYTPGSLAERNGSHGFPIGVFVGAMWGDYQLYGVDDGKYALTTPQSFYWSLSNRISYFFNFSGPSFSVDTACSSSLSAIHLACESIKRGECRAAIAGGVNLSLHPNKYNLLSRLRFLSTDGKSRSFGADGDGYVPGEGVGAVLLKPVTRAIADGDHIYAVIKGSSVNHGGKTSGFTVPNPTAQANLIKGALASAHVDPRRISYLEAHGTGTALGDPIEIAALTKAFGTSRRPYCAIGSVKSNIGHLEAAAGIAGLTKVLLQMQYQQLVPSLHARELNPNIEFKDSPFYVQQALSEWDPPAVTHNAPSPRLAGISSFGAGGANAHLIVEAFEPRPLPVVLPRHDPYLVVLSAKDDRRLKQNAKQLAAFLEAQNAGQQAIDIIDLAYTLQVGRVAMVARLALVVSDHSALIEKLRRYCSGGGNPPDCYNGNADQGRTDVRRLIEDREGTDVVQRLIQDGRMGRLAQLWTAGISVDWNLLYPDRKPLRISLPTYSFAKERFWVARPDRTGGPRSVGSAPGSQLHPLIGQNTSTLTEQRFATQLDSTGPYISDHMVAGQNLFPAAAYLEMARAAGAIAGEDEVRSMRSMVWGAPLVLSGVRQETRIRLRPSADGVDYDISTHSEDQSRVIHAKGHLVYWKNGKSDGKHLPAPKALDVEDIMTRCQDHHSGSECYRRFKEKGFHYGPGYQAIKTLYVNETEALAQIELPSMHRETSQDFGLHPSLLDGALQTVLGLVRGNGSNDNGLYLPFALGEIELFRPLTDTGYAFASATPSTAASDALIKKFDITMTDDTGEVLVRLKELVLKASPSHITKRAEEITASVPAVKTVYYRSEWQLSQAKTDAHDAPEPRPLIVFDIGSDLVDALEARSAGTSTVTVVGIKPGQGFKALGDRQYEIDPTDPEHYHKLLAALVTSGLRPVNILHAWSGGRFGNDPERIRQQLERSVYSVLYLTQALMAQQINEPARIIYLHAQNHPLHEALGGLAKTVATENPRILIKTVGVPDASPEKDEVKVAPFLTQVLTEFAPHRDRFREIRLDQGQCWVRQLSQLSPAEALSHQDFGVPLKRAGVYLITGGAGGLGLIMAHYLAQTYHARLVLSGRSALSAAKQSAVSALNTGGAEAAYVQADVSRRRDVVQLVAAAKARFQRIDGIIHCAGVVNDSFVLKKRPEEMAAVLAPKIFGTVNLDHATRSEALDFFVLFSSIAGQLGNLGQADYAYANRFLDHFAAQREKQRAAGRRKGRSLSIDWPLWRTGGMTMDETAERRLRQTTGMVPLDRQDGLQAFEKSLRMGATEVTVFKGDTQTMQEHLHGTAEHTPSGRVHPQEENPPELTGPASTRLTDAVQHYLKEILSKEIEMPAARIRSRKALETYGIDSVMILNLNQALEKDFGKLSQTLFFEYRTIAELAGYFLKHHRQEIRAMFGPTEKAASPIHPSKRVGETTDPIAVQPRFINPQQSQIGSDAGRGDIAIIGLGGRYPMARDLAAFWRNLKTGKDCITEVPKERWDHRLYFDPDKTRTGKSYSKWGGFVDDVDKFDPLFFNISPQEAELMDPQERLFLETVWHTLEDAGYSRAYLDQQRVGVFVGVMWGQYQLFGAGPSGGGNGVVPGSSYASIANRVSYYFDFNGPSMAVDTMCSSSLSAIHLACETIKRGESDLAFAGGVNVSIHPNKYIELSRERFVSSDGRCRSFGDGGDGYVPGEGVGAVLLKPLDKAAADGDHIYAVIKGSSVNHGGKTNGYTVPNPNAQARLIADSLKKAAVDPRRIGYLEAHGTGTALGDPIEISGLMQAFQKYTRDTGFCAIGSVKSNIGHLESAAGIAGLTKVLLQMQHKKLVPSLHAQTLNPKIDFKASPFFVQQDISEWRPPVDGNGRPQPRLAAVSSFGAGGANAHLILEEHAAPKPAAVLPEARPHVIVLSAKSEERLERSAEALVAFLDTHHSPEKSDPRVLDFSREDIRERLQAIAAHILNVDARDIEPDEELSEYGFDEILLALFAEGIGDGFDFDGVGPEIFLKQRSITALAQWLSQHHAAEKTTQASTESLPESDSERFTIADLAYTLQVGRSAMEARLALVVSDIPVLVEKLRRFCRGTEIPPDCYCGNTETEGSGAESLVEGREGRDFLQRIIQDGKLTKLARLWTTGVDVDWRLLYPEQKPRRIGLPTYPFARERYWMTPPDHADADHRFGRASDGALHPLVDRNDSTLEAQCYTKRLSPQAFYIKDHMIGKSKVFPGAAYLEMARAAGELAYPNHRVAKLKDIIWSAPLVPTHAAQEVRITLHTDGDGVGYDIMTHDLDHHPTIHSQGRVVYSPAGSLPEPQDALDIEMVKSRCGDHRSGTACYRQFDENGFHYGPGFRAVQALSVNGSEALARIALPSGLEADFHVFGLHPSLLDGALQTVLGLVGGNRSDGDGIYLPLALKELEVLHPLTTTGYAHAVAAPVPAEAEAAIKKFDITMTDDTGKVLVKLKELTVKAARSLSEEEVGGGRPDPVMETQYYKGGWHLAPWTAAEVAEAVRGPLVVFEDGADWGDALTARSETGAPVPVVRVKPGKVFQAMDDRHYKIDPADPAHYHKLLAALADSGRHPVNILHSWSQSRPDMDADRLQDLLDRGVYSVFHLTQALMARRINEAVRLLFLHDPDQPLHAAVSGLANTVRLENPRILIKTVEIQRGGDQGPGSPDFLMHSEQVMTEFAPCGDGPSEIRLAAGKRWIRQLSPVSPPADHSGSGQGSRPPLKNGGVYLITGGAGGLGLIMARYLSRYFKARLVLAGRTALSSEIQSKLQELSTAGGEAIYVRSDVSRRQDVTQLITAARSRFQRIDGILHCAGVIRDSFVLQKRSEEMAKVLAPKIFGTVNLDLATQSEDLDFFVLFSSIAGRLGNPGQADYAYANRFMDHFATQREKLRVAGRRRGLSLAIDWPLWHAGGMTMDEAAERRLRHSTGMVALDRQEGLRAFEESLRMNATEIMVVRGEARTLPMTMQSIASPTPTGDAQNPERGSRLLTRAERTQLTEAIRTHLKNLLSKEIKLPVDRIRSRKPLDDYGIDSVRILNLNQALEIDFGALSKTLFFEYRTIAKLADYLMEDHPSKIIAKFGPAEKVPPPAMRPSSEKDAADPMVAHARFLKPRQPHAGPAGQKTDIAIIGLGGRYPMAGDLTAFWQNLKSGKDCISEIPKDRWNHRRYFDGDKSLAGKSYSKWGGFIDGVDRFDPLFFNISPKEAQLMDPQERLFLQTAWQTLEDAGYAHTRPENERVGVFVGVMWGEYQLFGGDLDRHESSALPGASYASVANRVSYYFGFNGPSIALDTMCSSSLTAIHLACETIKRGESDLAIAGGVNISIHPRKYLLLSQHRFASSDGRCRSFGDGGDGYVPGEGVGAVLLKPLAKAVADGDHIYAVIKGSSVNHGGRTSGFTVPNPNAQARLIADTLQSADVDPRRIGYLEAHGTGTVLGDPIEISGLTNAFQKYTRDTGFCAIGSVKSNIGHLESAAGIAGLTKVLLQMRNKQLVPSLHAQTLNPNIDFKASPFFVQQDISEWRPPVDGNGRPQPRLAGISSFGAGGANAHIILEEHMTPKPAARRPQKRSHLIVLSAKNDERLKVSAGALADFLDAEAEAAHQTTVTGFSLIDLAYSLQVGRMAMEARLAFVVSDIPALIEKLRRYCRGPAIPSDCYSGNAGSDATAAELLIEGPEGQNYIRGMIQDDKLSKLARLWTGGVDIDWDLLYAEQKPRRVPLPTYPFARERHWVPQPDRTEVLNRANGAPGAALHPLIDRNESTIEEQCFTKRLSPEAFYIEDHVVGKTALLPGTGYLEMARAAGDLAYRHHRVVKISDALWVRPLALNGASQEARITLQPNGHGLDYEISTYVPGEQAQHHPVIDSQKIIHARGKVGYRPVGTRPAQPAALDIEAVKARCPDHLSGEGCYRRFAEAGFNYGPGFQVVETLFRGGGEALAKYALPPGLQAGFQDFGLHPSLLDGALQTVLGLVGRNGSKDHDVYLPFALAALELFQPLTETGYAHAIARSCAETDDAGIKKYDITMTDDGGRVLATLKELAVKHSRTIATGGVVMSAPDPEVKTLYYRSEWTSLPVKTVDMDAVRDNSLVAFEEGTEIEAALRTRSGNGSHSPVVMVRPGEDFKALDDGHYEIDPADPEHYHKLLAALADRDLHPVNILHAGSRIPFDPDPDRIPHQLDNSVYSVFYLTRALMAQRIKATVRVTCLHTQDQPLHAAVSGMAKTVALENPHIRIKTVEVSSRDQVHGQPYVVSHLAQVLAEFGPDGDADSEIRLAEGQRWVRQLSATAPPEDLSGGDSGDGLPLKRGGVYVISGGAGGLGLIMAHYLARNYHAHLVLAGRSALSGKKQAKLQELSAAGGEAIYVRSDVSRYQDAAQLIAAAKKRFKGIDGILHCAGVIKDSFVLKKNPVEMAAVLAPKILGTVNLDNATKGEALDFFVLFSSVAGRLGNPGQADYAYANRFMDHFAAYREQERAAGRRRGRSLSIDWPLWRTHTGGMTMDAAAEKQLRQTTGMVPLDPQDGLQAFENSLRMGASDVMVVRGQAQTLAKTIHPTALPTPGRQTRQPQAHHQNQTPSEATQLTQATRAYLKAVLSKEIKLPVAQIRSRKVLEDYGIDSVMILNLNQSLEEDFGELSKTLFFEYHTIAELADYFMAHQRSKLIAKFGPTEVGAPPEPQPPLTAGAAAPVALPSRFGKAGQLQIHAAGRETEIAIVGLSGRYPMAPDLNAFWQNLKAGRDCITEIPKERWNYRPYFDPDKNQTGKIYNKWGGFIDDVDKFDPLFFNISPKEAELMDPQERLFLQTVWQTIEDAGYTRPRLEKDRVGVFVGVMWGEYQLYGADLSRRLTSGPPGSSYASIANRVSYYFGFNGPSIALDTMCSSSLTAIHLACETIKRGESDLAIAGGVNVSIHPQKYLQLSQHRFASSDGRCRSFGDGGDGYVPGEGVGAVLLKPLAKAVADGDHIYAVIKGSSVNHGGKTNGYTVPNPQAQARLIADTLKKADVDPRHIGYLEAHGTGTALGDPIEISGLMQAFQKHTRDTGFCAIGSVKSNIGHLESAAGIAGLTKVLLQMQHKKLVPSLHAQTLNPNIDFKASPFFVQQDISEWRPPVDGNGRPQPRLAGISSFGAGGANAHIILEAYAPPVPVRAPIQRSHYLIVLSAKDDTRLKVYAGHLAEFLERRRDASKGSPADFDLADLAYTLQVGREAMDRRLALTAADIGTVINALKRFHQGQKEIDGLLRGPAGSDMSAYQLLVEGSAGGQFIQTLVREGDLDKLSRLWTSGIGVNWDLFYPQQKPKRVTLPTYPFARERYWVPQPDVSEAARHATGVPLHPLIGRNTSTLKAQRFATRLSEKQLNFKDHVVAGQSLFPAAAYLEMARAAGTIAGENDVQRLNDMLWVRPLVLNGQPQDVRISLRPGSEGVGYEISTHTEAHEKITHAQGRVAYRLSGERPARTAALDIAAIKARCGDHRTGADCYRLFEAQAFHYGPGFQAITALFTNGTEALARIALPSACQSDFQAFGLHPSLLDGALQTVLGLVACDGSHDGGVYLPFALGELELLKPLTETGFAYAVAVNAPENDGSPVGKFNITMTDDSGKVLVKLKELAVKSSPPKPAALAVKAPLPSVETLYYRNRWLPAQIGIDAAGVTDGTLVVFETGTEFVDALGGRSVNGSPANLIGVKAGKDYRMLDDRSYEIDPANPDHYHKLLAALADNDSHPVNLLHALSQGCFGHKPDDLKDQLDRSVYSVFYLTQALMARRINETVRMVYLYAADHPLYAAVSGLAKTVGLENPQIKIKAVGVRTNEQEGCTPNFLAHLGQVMAEFASGRDQAAEVRLHQGRRWVRQLSEVVPGTAAAGNDNGDRPPFKPGGVYVITGGAGGLGLILARYLARNYRARLLLTGRSDLNGDKRAQLKVLNAYGDGSAAVYIRADVSRRREVRALMAEAKTRFQHIDGVIHCAGVVQDSFVLKKGAEEMSAVLAPKIFGAVNLDHATRSEDLDFFVLFSSIAGQFGNVGQADYAYANRFMDHFAARRERMKAAGKRRGVSLSIDWPLWQAGGM